MGLTYDITKDYLYQEGLAEGEEKRREEKKEVITEMLKDGSLTLEKIASLTKVSVDYVKQVEKEIRSKI